MTATIHTAYSMHRSNGSTYYRAVAVVTNPGLKCHHTHRTAIDDSAAQAVVEAVQHVRDTYRREGLAQPETQVDHGRKHRADIEAVSFAS